ncbi:uncharacterized protein LOC135074850 [Ostrinia nubilalis]|uniref:uncharacterized protein LOC135074850 n=1 Tax=Ostrinia nubilalis TaxID=29057 RepID=UPI0030824B09
MLFEAIVPLLGCVLAVQCRDNSKAMKSIPSITSSLVNLGKMDISFHFNNKEPIKTDQNVPLHSTFLFSKSDPTATVEEPCPCSGLRSANNFLNKPSDLLNKILMSNDLFSFNKDPVSSTFCCGSHEHAQEDVVTFEFGPKTMNLNSPPTNLPGLPFIFESLFPKKPIMTMPAKPKAVEIFLFPKKKDQLFPMRNELKKEAIQIVGDKEMRNDFKSLKFRPMIPLNLQSSVKKDLTAQERNETKKQVPKEEAEITTIGNSNAL